MNLPTTEVPTAERDEFPSPCKELEWRLRVAEKEVSIAQIEKTELIEELKKSDLKNSRLQAKMPAKIL